MSSQALCIFHGGKTVKTAMFGQYGYSINIYANKKTDYCLNNYRCALY